MFKVLFVLPLIAFVDPFLLYWMWPHLTLWMQVVGLIVYPLVANIYTRSKVLQEGDVITRVTRILARAGAWYPGPISKVLSFFLILPPVERVLIRIGNSVFQQHILRGINAARPGAAAGTPSIQSGPSAGDENLKQVRGRVVD